MRNGNVHLRLVHGGGSSPRGQPKVVRVGSLECTIVQEHDGTWSATAVLGRSSGHCEAKEAVHAILAKAKPFLGMKAHEELVRAFWAIEGDL